MRIVPVSDLKNRLGHYLRLVAGGESATITVHGRPVARLTRLQGKSDESAALLLEGLARPPVKALPEDFLRRKLPKAEIQAGLAEDREDRF